MQINRIRGDTYADQFLVKNVNTGDVVNLAGCSAILTLNREKNPENTTSQVYQLTGVFDEDTSTGLIDFSPNSTQADLVGLFYYDVQLTDANGIVRTIAKDAYLYEQDITKD